MSQYPRLSYAHQPLDAYPEYLSERPDIGGADTGIPESALPPPSPPESIPSKHPHLHHPLHTPTPQTPPRPASILSSSSRHSLSSGAPHSQNLAPPVVRYGDYDREDVGGGKVCADEYLLPWRGGRAGKVGGRWLGWSGLGGELDW